MNDTIHLFRIFRNTFTGKVQKLPQKTNELGLTLEMIDMLDLEPIVFKLVRPEPGVSGLSIEAADVLVIKYRRYLKLCAMYPERSIVPSRDIDLVWHAHILDTSKYQEDCKAIFGYMLHHFPYLGTRGADDEATWRSSFRDTCILYELHFAEVMAGSGAGCTENGGDEGGGTESLCDSGACDSAACTQSSLSTRERPRLIRR